MKSTIIGVAGGTGSGKSTFTNRIKDAFGEQVSVIYYDNYYKAQDEIPFEERKKVNYDSPEALETDLLIQHLMALKNGQAVELIDVEDVDEIWSLTLDKLLHGMQMAIDNGDWNGDVDELDGAIGDMIFQYGLFDEVVFG